MAVVDASSQTTRMEATASARPGGALSRLPSLTGLRWIAAMLVFGFHVGTMRIIAEPDFAQVVGWMFSLGLSGVQFFFILSGFVLVWSARPGDSPWAFWHRRVAKIFPNHIVLWAAVILVGFAWADPLDLRVALANLFLVQAWIPVGGWFYSINTVSWSISCEMFFYLCLPLVLPALRRARPWHLYALVIAVPLLILALWPAQALVPETDRWWFTQVFPLVRSLEFWMGVAAAELMRRGSWRGPSLRWASIIFLATWVAAAGWIRAEFWAALMAAVYVLVITGAARADIEGRPSLWRSRPMIWLGEISFAYYLLHVFTISTILRYFGRWPGGLPGWQGPAAVVGFLLLNLALAWLLFRFVETPMMRLLGPRRRRTVTPPRQARSSEDRTGPAGRTPVDSDPPPAGDARSPDEGGRTPADGGQPSAPGRGLPAAARPGPGLSPHREGDPAAAGRR